MPRPVPLQRVSFASISLAMWLVVSSFGCAEMGGMAGGGGTEAGAATPWSQVLVTQGAQLMMQRFQALYGEAQAQPAVVGAEQQRTDLLAKLGELKEQSSTLYQKLSEGKGKAETASTWEGVRSLSREARASEYWSKMPPDLSQKADLALYATDQLAAFYQ